DLKNLGNLMVLKASSHIQSYLLNKIKIDIVDYAYPWLSEAIHVDGIQLAGLTDIAAMKLAAITGRGTKKDFIDLYFLSKRFTLSEMQSFYERKYLDGSMFMVLKSLSYFEDAEQDPSPYMLEPIDWEEIKRHILSLL
ncbi:nucleotidyl transferase AbiEii/AbiGii toxin family protein, partial [Parabacteroides sp.]